MDTARGHSTVCVSPWLAFLAFLTLPPRGLEKIDFQPPLLALAPLPDFLLPELGLFSLDEEFTFFLLKTAFKIKI